MTFAKEAIFSCFTFDSGKTVHHITTPWKLLFCIYFLHDGIALEEERTGQARPGGVLFYIVLQVGRQERKKSCLVRLYYLNT